MLPMPFINGKKYSKSELIAKLSDNRTREAMSNEIKKHTEKHGNVNLSIPPHVYKLNTKKTKLNTKNFKNMQAEELIEKLTKLSNQNVFKIVNSVDIPNNLSFTDSRMQIFYLSVLTYKIGKEIAKQREVSTEEALEKEMLKIEQKLLNIMYEIHKKGWNYNKYCIIKFSKVTIANFISEYSWNINEISAFLVSIACKLPSTAIQIWFDKTYDPLHKLFSRMHDMKVDTNNTPFNTSIFTELLKYQTFKKAVFNGNLSIEWIMGIKDYANRPDFEYFYTRNDINRSISLEYVCLPRDAEEFSFFAQFSGSIADLSKIRRYQEKIGNTIILNLWIGENINKLQQLLSSEEEEIFEIVWNIFTSQIQSNSLIQQQYKQNKDNEVQNKIEQLNMQKMNTGKLNNSQKINKAVQEKYADNSEFRYNEALHINNKLFELMKAYEEPFKKIVNLFENTANTALKKLLTCDSSLSLTEAFSLINLGFEHELCEFFVTQQVKDYLGLIDNWSLPFFLSLFSTIYYTPEDAVLILQFIEQKWKSISTLDNMTKIYEIYNKILTVESEVVFNSLPNQMKFVYILKHPDFNMFYKNIQTCNLIEAAFIYKLNNKLYTTTDELHKLDILLNKFIDISTHDNESILYQLALTEEVHINTNHLITSLFINNFIFKNDSFGLFFNYFDQFINHATTILTKSDLITLVENTPDYSRYFSINSELVNIKIALEERIQFTLIQQIAFVAQMNFSDRYSLYTLFDKINTVLLNGTSAERILVLNFIKPALLSKNHILKFIDCIIPLLNSSNRTLCELSRQKFRDLKVETAEVQNILPDIIMCFESKGHFEAFISRFSVILFNNYLCFNSLNIIVQLLFRYLETNTAECLNIFNKLLHITKDKDIKHVSGLIFANISKFVVNNNFYTAEALEVASQFCLYAKYEDFDILMKNRHSLRICNYLVGILKIKGDSTLNNDIITAVISNRKDTNNDLMSYNERIEPAFIAAACELSEFGKYVQCFLPVIKHLFVSQITESRQIACKAINSLFSSQIGEEYKQELRMFLIDLCTNTDHNIRLAILNVLDCLPLIFILRNDTHTLVKKKAYDLWKSRVSNTNKELKTLYVQVFSFLKYSDAPLFSQALKATINEMATKYPIFCEYYLNDTATSNEFKLFILIECAKIAKFVDHAVLFCTEHFNSNLFKILCKNTKIRDELIEKTDKFNLIEVCAEDSELALYLFSKTGDPVYIDFLTYSQKIEIIRSHHITAKNVSIEDESVIFTLQSIESSGEIEQLLIRIHPSFSFYYLLVNRVDYGLLDRIFERVFGVCYGLDELINERTVIYLKNCNFDRVQNKKTLLMLLIKLEDRKAFERSAELIKSLDFASFDFTDDHNDLFCLLGYLCRGLLSESRKVLAEECLIIIYNQMVKRDVLVELGFFKIMIEQVVSKQQLINKI